jgi:hypothetical protein
MSRSRPKYGGFWMIRVPGEIAGGTLVQTYDLNAGDGEGAIGAPEQWPPWPYFDLKGAGRDDILVSHRP